MEWTEWFLFFIVIQIIHGLATFKMYVAAGHKPWEAFVPVYNAYILTKIINRPWYWVLLLFLPVVNLIMFIVIWVDLLRSFGYNQTKHTVLVILTLGLYLFYVNYALPLNHIKERELKPRTAAGEWTNSILFAVIAATIVHTYVMQPFIIPTSSLEKTLLIGDALFVSKFHYGARLPMTPIAFPMVHDTIPVANVKSYLPRPQLPYTRLPGFQEVKRNDIVVFNWPVDSVNIYGQDDGKYHYKPIDKKSNYVKRCVGIPGDLLSMKNGEVYINGELLEMPERAKLQNAYAFTPIDRNVLSNPAILREKYDITDGLRYATIHPDKYPDSIGFNSATKASMEKLKADGVISNYQKIEIGIPDYRAFPYNASTGNNSSTRKEFLIPAKSQTVEINNQNIDYYKEIIEVYEGSEMNISNTISFKGNQVLLNEKPLTSYTFKQNYYWLMGDNRDNSLDSRYWGYVPETHIVGKPVLIWASYDTSKSFPSALRTDRMIQTVNGDGKPKSYLLYVVIAIGIYFAGRYLYKKKKGKK
ncbi:signal peptidase I [Nonlabens tegetincola]|nr:signal peptidase I [Nonlabens tegetincola]